MDITYILIGGLGLGISVKMAWSAIRTFRVKVITVIDGDTYQVVNRKGKQFKVRLRGVDCPELLQSKGPEAAQYASTLIHKKWVSLRVFGRDRYGRTVGDIRCEKGDLASLMVKAGWAHVLNNRKSLKIQESMARLRRKGIWRQWWVTKPWHHKSRRR